MDSARLDAWLNAARIFKTRSTAARAVRAGQVKVGGERVRPSRQLRPGDRISITIPRRRRELEVLDLEVKRQSPVRARELYREHEAEIPPEERELMEILRRAGPRRETGMGRPTKRERRILDRFRRRGRS
jgi:ribosome-associated heat shock protein Hsp15